MSTPARCHFYCRSKHNASEVRLPYFSSRDEGVETCSSVVCQRLYHNVVCWNPTWPILNNFNCKSTGTFGELVLFSFCSCCQFSGRPEQGSIFSKDRMCSWWSLSPPAILRCDHCRANFQEGALYLDFSFITTLPWKINNRTVSNMTIWDLTQEDNSPMLSRCIC